MCLLSCCKFGLEHDERPVTAPIRHRLGWTLPSDEFSARLMMLDMSF